jgi:small GTP-binding protein
MFGIGSLKDEAGKIIRAVEAEFMERPPAIAVIGVSGVGKSATINAMFGTKLAVSATTRGTSRFSNNLFQFESNRVEGASVKCALRVYDAPGLGEDAALDANYLDRYRRHLPKCDVALWVIAARNRALALDQQYLRALAPVLPNTVIAINQADLIDPLDWDTRLNLPSRAQERHMAQIVEDRRSKLSHGLGLEFPAVAYSAAKYYNLQKMFAACVKAAPADRRWMFEILKAFSTWDWLDKASGISDAAKDKLAAQYIASDAPVDVRQLRSALPT